MIDLDPLFTVIADYSDNEYKHINDKLSRKQQFRQACQFLGLLYYNYNIWGKLYLNLLNILLLALNPLFEVY